MNTLSEKKKTWSSWPRAFCRGYYDICFNKEFRHSILWALFIFIAGMVAYVYSAAYATEKASNSVTDIILSNTPTFDVDGLFVYGALAGIVFITLLCLNKPRRIPFILSSIGLFFLIRSVFVSVTHIGPFPSQIVLNVSWTTVAHFIGGGDDLFFSGHTGLPFLMGLIFWKTPWLRYIFLVTSVFFGVVVLLGHLHYTIDVLSAFFITYGINDICVWLFPKERALFLGDMHSLD